MFANPELQQSSRAGSCIRNSWELPLPNPSKSKPKAGIFFTQCFHNRCKLKTQTNHCFPAGILVQGGIQATLEQGEQSRDKPGSATPSLGQPGQSYPCQSQDNKDFWITVTSAKPPLLSPTYFPSYLPQSGHFQLICRPHSIPIFSFPLSSLQHKT